jgi:hypothetical protein
MLRKHTWLKCSTILVGIVIVLGGASPVYAHGFGDRYDLPVPLWLYLAGAGAAVAFSFVVIGVFVRGTPGLHGYPRFDLLRWPVGRFAAHTASLFVIKLASVLLFVLLVLTGVLGDQAPDENLTPTFVWVIWWIGLAYLSAFVGNAWALLSPWKIIFGWADSLYRRLNSGERLSLEFSYPRRLGVWPGVVLFGVFAWVEVVYPGSADPGTLAKLAFAYSFLTWVGMGFFGKHTWLRYGDAFSLAFGYLSRFSPTEVRIRNQAICDACSSECRNRDGECVDCYECFELAESDEREWNLRPFAAGLVSNEEVTPSQMVFVLLLLATVTFDGFTATPAWATIVRNSISSFWFLGGHALTAVSTVGLITFPFLFLAVFWGFSALMTAFAGAGTSVGNLARTFIYSLIPIALAYHLAHFFSFLLIQGQLIVPLASDPFGFGWDLFGTTEYQVDIGIINARLAWFTGVAAIVIGHIVAVYVAHLFAVRLFTERWRALRSQYPMLGLMVGYTMVSLWILAQPIVETATNP